MHGKKILNYALLAAALSVGVELVKDALQQASTQANLDSILLDYTMLGKERFSEKLLEVCRRDNLPHLEASDIRITEDRQSGFVRVEVHYSRTLRLLFYPVKRHLVASATIRQPEL